MEEQVISKERVAKHGEVFTSSNIVNAMLDLVKQETERIESRFLEPACGNGNFLAPILERKLDIVEKRYRKSQRDWEFYAVLAVSSIYGIDIQDDNVKACRDRLFGIFDLNYLRWFSKKTKDNCRESVRCILECNIIHGDALSLKTCGEQPEPIIFAEWSPINNRMFKRRDFIFEELLNFAPEKKQLLLFPDSKGEQLNLFSDLGKEVFIPTPRKEYPPVHFLEIRHVQ